MNRVLNPAAVRDASSVGPYSRWMTALLTTATVLPTRATRSTSPVRARAPCPKQMGWVFPPSVISIVSMVPILVLRAVDSDHLPNDLFQGKVRCVHLPRQALVDAPPCRQERLDALQTVSPPCGLRFHRRCHQQGSVVAPPQPPQHRLRIALQAY